MTTKFSEGWNWAPVGPAVVGVALAAVSFVGTAAWVCATDKPTPTTEPPLQAKIADLAWIQGHWHAEGTGSARSKDDLGVLVKGDELEEYWSAPAGDSMVGVFRWIKEGKAWLFELMTIVEDDGEVFFRLKHFGREMKGWEKKNVALTYKLVQLGQRRAVFENVGEPMAGPWRTIYHRTDDSSLVIRLEGKSERTVPDVFHFRRRSPGN